MNGKTALVIGATGLVGKQLVNQLLSNERYTAIKLFVRRPTQIEDPKIKEYLIDFEDLPSIQKDITGDILFSCLGTTLKQAGSKKAQYRIDYTYQYEFARIASENAVPDYMLISSPSANPKSMLFYTRIKGELEEAVKKLGFSKICIIQPSVLSGDRPEKRPGEEVGGKIINALGRIFPFARKYRSISGETVAKAMVALARKDETSRVSVYKLDELFMKQT